MPNKKAQIGETMTWVVATIIVIVTLIIFIYASTLLGKTSEITRENYNVEVDKQADWINTKTSLAHEVANNKNKEVIDNWIKEENEN
ncbi:hypothetical protein BMS3Abin17_00535 [archaeon BMS3Abin17]|nr:hypothetical protein BMS3Abin17_00535 [archaeon BMS3Abin17]HDZ60447.1 hypothetical protein [Candidatus Pacearchaeota archaeon]